jgi:hypothetical protein
MPFQVIPKNAHLARLEGAAENLRLFKADMLEPDALAALAACEGVFHVACPVPMDKATDPEVSSVSFTWSNCLFWHFRYKFGLTTKLCLNHGYVKCLWAIANST